MKATKTYDLIELESIGDGHWRCVVSEPTGVQSRFVWWTTETTEQIQARAERLIARLQSDYAARIHGKRATSHWHKLAATGAKRNNLEMIKDKNHARIQEWLEAKEKKR